VSHNEIDEGRGAEFSKIGCCKVTPKLCIYCSSKADKAKEHCLPRGLGNFRNHHILRNIICLACNKPISIAEEQFLRASPEAFIRRVLGIEGRKYHKAISPFYRGSAGAPRLEMMYQYPKTKLEILWEVIPGTKNLVPLRQIGMSIEEGKIIPIPLPEKITSGSDLLKHLRECNLEKAEPVYYFSAPGEWDDLVDIIRQLWPDKKVNRMPVIEDKSTIATPVKITVTSHYFRALAKIGLHYFLAMSRPRFTGTETAFEPIRSFIRDGKGQPENFVVQNDTPILHELNRGYSLSRWGHLLTARIGVKMLISRVQFFIGPEYLSPIFDIKLGKNPSKIFYPEHFGHFYSYFSEKHKSGYDGEVSPLKIISKALLPT